MDASQRSPDMLPGTPESRSENIARLNIDGNTIELNGVLIIDARNKLVGASGRRWTNRDELEKLDYVFGAIRTVCETGAYYKDVDLDTYRLFIRFAAIRALRELNFETVSDVIIAGNIPSHWVSDHKITQRWLLKKDKWEEYKRVLLDFVKTHKSR